MSKFKSLLPVAVYLSLSALAAFAQTDRGTITGTVSDPAGAVVPNATVEARNSESGTLYKAGSTATGNFTIAQIPAGTYELSVAVAGFKKFVRPGIIVQVAQTIRTDAVLEVGAATDTITVNAEAPLLKTESGELSHNVEYARVDSLPILTLTGSGVGAGNIRNPLQVVTLLPGASFQGENTLRVNGMPSSSQAIRVEGQDATNGMWRQLNQINQMGVDAIQEVSIQTSNFAAEYGQAGGGYFNYTMKSGTNTFHGSAYDYFDNEALNAGLAFTDAGASDSLKSGQHVRNRLRRSDYGFTLGGPVIIPKLYNGREKTFFFFNFEQFRESQTTNSGFQTVPTLAYRNGDFSGALLPNLSAGGVAAVDGLGRNLPQNAIYDPDTQRLAPDGTTVRDQFISPDGRLNVMPVSRMDPVALKVQSLLPLPQGPLAANAINNYAIPGYTNFRHTTIPSFKIDHSLTSTIRLSGFFSATLTNSPSANGFTQVFTAAEPQANESYTTRINYDQTITPTLLLHLGGGLVDTIQPAVPRDFDQSTLGWAGNFYVNQFPNFTGTGDNGKGGLGLGAPNPAFPIGTGFGVQYLKDIKPTANANLTWVRGNHTYKAGAEMVIEGFPQLNFSRANGQFGFSAQQTSNPWEFNRGLNGTTGFPYASFLLGTDNSLALSQVTNSRLGNHSLGFYIQDTWKVTRKLTLDYGLRYDYVTLLKEQYGRMQNAAFDQPNPAAGGRLGTVIYEATCKCSFNKNYPYAYGPRLGAAYQLNSKTVIRVGAGVAYGSSPNNAFLSYSVPDFYTLAAPGYGAAATQLSDGNPYAPGNKFGNKGIVWPDFSPNYPFLNQGTRVPGSPFISIDRNAGRPPRILQWSIGVQREVIRNLLVEASYVGNRGVWWSAPLLATYNYNALTPESLKSTWGLDITNPADRALLSQPLSSAAVIARFPQFANPNNVYPGFPSTQPLNQALRPYPQWNGVPPFLGPPLGDTWYDSLQAKVTKRYSHGLDIQTAFTWQKELTLGANSDTSYLTPNPPLINDVFNYKQNKQISGFSRPLVLVISFNYTTPKMNLDGKGMKALSWAARDWVLGGVLRYQSGALIRSAGSNNGLLSQLGRGATNNPALWGGGATFQNRVPGQNVLQFDPNCKCFDPTTQTVLNPAAWTDAAPGTFGTAAPYYNDVRWQRQPAESLAIGRTFRFGGGEGKASLNIRAEFQNVFNRLFLNSTNLLLSATNPQAPTTRSNTGAVTSGYGYVNTVNGGGTIPRTGQLVARFTF
jgi:Carboxypeptidase regulatory-like domain/TonB dependent receptor